MPQKNSFFIVTKVGVGIIVGIGEKIVISIYP